MKTSIKVIFALLVMSSSTLLHANNYRLFSPNKAVEINISLQQAISYSVQLNGEELVAKSAIALQSNDFDTGNMTNVLRVDTFSHMSQRKFQWGIAASALNSYNGLIVHLHPKLQLEFRAYDDGVAYRFVSNFDAEQYITSELAQFNLPQNAHFYAQTCQSFQTSFEDNYLPFNALNFDPKMLAMTPVMIRTESGKSAVVSEVNLFHYPGMFIKPRAEILEASFPKYPKREAEEILGRLRLSPFPQFSNMLVKSTHNYIARTPGKHNFPWRAILVANADVDLLQNKLVSVLSQVPDNMDFSWVKPGKVVWDWYHGFKIENVDFKSGINTATYKYMIDFAAEHGIEYVNVDDGWSRLHYFNRINKKLDLPEIIRYANEKNVGIFLWAMYQTLEKNLERNLNMFQQMGVKGLKVDFFDRSDQKIVDFVNRLAHECAKRKLLLNLHGIYKPTGLEFTYPNVLNFEAVAGLEFNKFSDKCTPQHNLCIPFIRNVVGAMDYTPGSMRYQTPETFKKSWFLPHSMSTRAQQMAMYVLYHGGLQMLADATHLYVESPVFMHFVSKVPVSFDESIAIDAALGKYACVARRKDNVWFLAAMCSDDSYTKTIDLNFLDNGAYKAHIYSNGSVLDEVLHSEVILNNKSTLKIEMPRMGGYVVRFVPVK